MKYILLICFFFLFNMLNAQTEFTYFNKTFWNDSMNILSPIVKPVDDGYITFGTYGTATMTSYVYIRKIDKYGNTLWTKNLDSEIDGDIGAVIWGGQCFIKNDSEIYLTYSKDLFDGQKRDVNLLKLDTAGNIIWKRTYGSDRHEFAQYMMPTLDGGTALAGVRWWEADTASQMYIAKTDLFGTLQWEKTYAPNWGEAFSIQETWWDGGYIVGSASLTDSLNLLYDIIYS